MNRRHFLASTAGLALFAGSVQADETVRTRELYSNDLSFSDYALEMAGQTIDVWGFMAPPLRADSNFFVLTNRPMAVCPFCETEADWPNDILAVYTQRQIDIVPFNVRITTRGRLDLGTYRDSEFGFVSRARLMDASFRRG
jgi:hypothetical protein